MNRDRGVPPGIGGIGADGPCPTPWHTPAETDRSLATGSISESRCTAKARACSERTGSEKAGKKDTSSKSGGKKD